MTPNFLAENELRRYPFLGDVEPRLDDPGTGSQVGLLPDDAIVDFRTILAGDDTLGTPSLYAIARSGSTLTFEFRGTGGLAGLALKFVAPSTTAEFARLRSSAVSIATSDPVTDPCGFIPTWDGTLVVGRLATLLALVPSGGSLRGHSGGLLLEPTLTMRAGGLSVRSVNIANRSRLLADEAVACGGSADPPDPREFVTNETCLVGAMRLIAGYNCVLSEDPAGNTITVAASDGAGQGRPCDEVVLEAGELPPTGSTLLSGGPTCGEIVGSINGVRAPVIRLIDGPGFRVITDTGSPHELILDLTIRDDGSC